MNYSLARTSGEILSRNGEIRYPCLDPDTNRKVPNFSKFSAMLATDWPHRDFIMLATCLLYPMGQEFPSRKMLHFGKCIQCAY